MKPSVKKLLLRKLGICSKENRVNLRLKTYAVGVNNAAYQETAW